MSTLHGSTDVEGRGKRDGDGGSEIPWGDIDPEIRPLVAVIDRWPGLYPVGSCAGHAPCLDPDYYEGYVAFRVNVIEALTAFLDALPEAVGLPKAGAWAHKRITGAFRTTCEDGILTFFLCIGGSPLDSQRELLDDMARKPEASLGRSA